MSSISANSMPVLSARWARDEDISRMLRLVHTVCVCMCVYCMCICLCTVYLLTYTMHRSLPSWKNMHDAANRAPFTILSEVCACVNMCMCVSMCVCLCMCACACVCVYIMTMK